MNAIIENPCHLAGLPTVDEALALLLETTVPVQEMESQRLAEAAGRILAHDAVAALSMPPCDRSAMDGYAFRYDDAGPLRRVGSALAGKPYAGAIAPGECVAIATGGAVPEGCDTVAMRELCTVTANGVVVSAKARGINIRRRGEDFQAGASLLPAGTVLGSRQIGLLAAAGLETVPVRRRLRVALVSMGDELAGSRCDAIQDANRPLLQALCAGNGFQVTDLGILPDSRARLAQTLAQAAVTHDIILTTAGTSVGDEDHACGAVLDCGGQLQIAGIAIKPGKPVSFGSIGGARIVALPGNPAAAYITFLLLGLPLLRHRAGSMAPPAVWHRVRAGFDHRKKPGLREYLRVQLVPGSDGTVSAERCRNEGSAMLASLAAADGLAVLAEAETEIREGDLLPFATFAALEAP